MEGIAGCRVLVVVFSSNANRSSHVINEVDAAVRKGAIIVPFRIEDVMPDGAMEYHLRTRHWLDALTPDLERHTAKLAEQVRQVLDTQRAPEMPTPPPRPMPSDLPKRPAPKPPAKPRFTWPTTREGWRRLGLATGAGALLLFAGTCWLLRDKPVGDVTFTVREVSGSGNNEFSIKMKSGQLRFFEAGQNVPPVGSRDYRTSFVASSTRYIDVEVDLSYEQPNRDVAIPIGCTLISKAGQVIAAITINGKVQASWTNSAHVQGWGNANGGFWKPDRYRADCKYGDKLIGRNWFDVTETAVASSAPSPAPAPAPPAAAPAATGPLAQAAPWRDLGMRVSRIKLFPMGTVVPDVSQRQAATTFDAATTTYIGVEVTTTFDQPPARAMRALLTCRFLKDRVTETGRMVLGYNLQAGWQSAWSARGYGRDTPGSWAPGTYLVACDDGRRTLAQTGFDVR